MLIVVIVVLALFSALGLMIRRHRRMLPVRAQHPERPSGGRG
jgi:hypothetical protein